MDGSKGRAEGARILFVGASLVVVIAGLKAATSLVLPLLIAVFLAMISLPLLNWLQSRKVPRGLAVLLTILADLVAIAAIGFLIGGSIAEFTAQVPKYQARLQQIVSNVLAWAQARGVEVDAELIMDLINPGQVLNMVTGMLKGVANVLQNLLFVILAIIFILAEAAGFPLKLEAAFGGRVAFGRFYTIRKEVQSYLTIKTLVSLTTGALVAAAMAIIGVDFPLLWGLLAFLLNYIPALGSILAGIPPFLLAIVQPDVGLGGAIAVVLVFLGINMLLGNFLEPYLMGRGLGLSGLVVFVSLIFWGWVWGPVGMLVSVPLTMVVKIMLENSQDLRWVAVLLDASPKPGRSAVAVPEPSEDTSPPTEHRESLRSLER